MNHVYIDAHDIRSRYVTRRLIADDERRFEAHLIECPDCQDSVQIELDLRDGLREVSTADGPGAAGRRTSSSLVASGPAALLATAAAILLAVAALLAVNLVRVTGQLGAATSEVDKARRDADQSARSAAAALGRLADAQLGSTAPAEASHDRGVLVAVFGLSTSRSASGDDAPPNLVRIGNATKWVVLSVDLAPGQSARFLTTLREESSGAVAWSGGPFEASPPETLSVALEADLLHAGNYVLSLDRRTSDGTTTPAGRYRFRVAARRP
jgi:hypothetical protein